MEKKQEMIEVIDEFGRLTGDTVLPCWIGRGYYLWEDDGVQYAVDEADSYWMHGDKGVPTRVPIKYGVQFYKLGDQDDGRPEFDFWEIVSASSPEEAIEEAKLIVGFDDFYDVNDIQILVYVWHSDMEEAVYTIYT